VMILMLRTGLFVAAPWLMVYPVSPDNLQMRWPRTVMSVGGRILRVKAVRELRDVCRDYCRTQQS
jgi:hypothetical protein